MPVSGVLYPIPLQIPRDAHVLSAQVLHDSNTIELGFTARANFALVDFRYFLSGQLAVLEIVGYCFAVVPFPVTESITDLGPATGLLDFVQLRLEPA
ncbi:hypothetical protein ADL12_13525 [Streptomyces regalis]|uniref:Uncharacterized protein n=1 Tax=Streptomyces regalis TaxID=68262 RepID=A0A0X3V643_9ACTN|nr:hypothetical protein ADL12_13525 [Streptomyces regalis]